MTLDTRVPEVRSSFAIEDIMVGEPVRATTWWNLASMLQWVRGRGRTLVPQHSVRQTITSGSRTYRYRTHPSGVALSRVWVLDIRQDPSSFLTSPGCEFTIAAGSHATSGSIRASGRALATTPIVYIETTGVTKTTSLTELTLTVTRVAGTPIIESIGCWELPRAALTKDSTDLGMSLDSFFPRRELFEATYEGTRAVVLTSAATNGRRIGHVSYFGQEMLTTSTSFVSVFEAPHLVVPRIDRPTDTTRSLTWDVYARATDGTTSGEFQIAIGSGGGSATIAVPLGGTTSAWRGTGTVTLKCEDLAAANGLRGGSYETADLQFRRTAGAGSIAVSGYDLWEST